MKLAFPNLYLFFDSYFDGGEYHDPVLIPQRVHPGPTPPRPRVDENSEKPKNNNNKKLGTTGLGDNIGGGYHDRVLIPQRVHPGPGPTPPRGR